MRRTIYTLFAIPLVLAGTLASGTAHAHFVPAPCDFITGGGWVLTDSLAFFNFGAHGGCKNRQFWGHVNALDHGTTPPGHLRSTEITGYLMDPEFPNARDICGIGEVSVNGARFTARFRVRMEDNGEPGGSDRFGLRLDNGYHLSTRELGPPGPTGGGGNIKLHKENKSTKGPSPAPSEFEMCGTLPPP